MASSIVKISDYHSPRQLSSEYDEEIPDDFLCSISQELLEDPVTVNCSAGHIFEKAKITTWLQSNNTCPIDREAITPQGIRPIRFAVDAIQRWKEEHSIQPIDSSKLADQILTPFSMTPEEKSRLAAHLRYVKAKDKTEEIGDSILQKAKEKHLEIPSSAKFQSMARIYLQGNASAALEQILAAAASENMHDELISFVREARKEKESQRERERELKEKNQRPLSTREKARVIALALLPTAAAAAGRVMAAWSDDNPNTGASEAFRFSAPDLFSASLSLTNLAVTWSNSGNAAVRDLSNQLRDAQVTTAMTSAVYAYNTAFQGAENHQLRNKVDASEEQTRNLAERVKQLEGDKSKKWFWQ